MIFETTNAVYCLGFFFNNCFVLFLLLVTRFSSKGGCLGDDFQMIEVRDIRRIKVLLKSAFCDS